MTPVLGPTLVWWLTVSVIGWAALPLAHWLLPTLPDRGAAFIRPIGLVVAGYVYWLGVTGGVLPNSRAGAAAATAVLLCAGGYIAWRSRQELAAFVFARRRLLLGYEVMFLVVLVLWAFVRAYTPNIEPAGGEKFMEMAFINAILKSPSFPPLDPWLSGFAISYYHFAYLQAALLTLLSGLQSSVAFNLMIPMTLAMTCVAGFGLGYGLVSLTPGSRRLGRLVGGAITAALVPLVGSLVGAVELGYMRGWGPESLYRWLNIRDLTPGGVCGTTGSGFGAGGWVPPRFIWWWRGSRVIHDDCGEVIHEFPFFSFLLGDVHPHVMALPYVLTVIGVGLAVLAGALDRDRSGGPSPRIAAIALLVGALGFMNTWDLPTFGLVVVLAFALRSAVLEAPPATRLRLDVVALLGAAAAAVAIAWRAVPVALAVVTGGAFDAPPLARASLSLAALLVLGAAAYTVWSSATSGDPLARRAVAVGRFTVWLGLLAVGMYLPFYIGFRSQAAGIGLAGAQSRLPQWLVHFGLMMFLAASLIAAWLPAVRRRLWWPSWVVLALGAPLVAYSVYLRQATPAMEALCLTAAAVVALQLWANWLADDEPDDERRPSAYAEMDDTGPTTPETGEVPTPGDGDDPVPVGLALPAIPALAATFALGCVALGLAVALIPELAFVKDVFSSRMNTVFKLFYQAWVLLAVGGAYAVYSVWDRWPRWAAALWAVPAAVMLVGSSLYPLQAIYTRTEGLARREITLDGLASWRASYPDDLAAVEWLREGYDGSTVIAEAYGGAYEHNGRISMASGLPTVLGWEGHEHQWRGTRDEIDPRKEDLERLYTTADAGERSELVSKYGVRFIVLSAAERSKYGISPAAEERLRSELRTAYEAPGGGLTILEAPVAGGVHD